MAMIWEVELTRLGNLLQQNSTRAFTRERVSAKTAAEAEKKALQLYPESARGLRATRIELIAAAR